MTKTIAVITGASQGLGAEVARLFAQRDYGLILTARGTEALRDIAHELEKKTEVLAIAGDVAQPTHAHRLIREALQRFGHIDVLVNNTSTLGPTPMPALEQYPLEALAHVFRVNALAPLHLAQLVSPGMREQGAGCIINVTSDAGVEAYPTWGGYGASKAALEHLSRVLAAELENSGVRVYVVDPGDMNTAMHRDAEPGVDLSDLLPPRIPAAAFLALVEQETASFGRFRAVDLVTQGVLHDGA